MFLKLAEILRITIAAVSLSTVSALITWLFEDEAEACQVFLPPSFSFSISQDRV
jgi:hypothetical protein